MASGAAALMVLSMAPGLPPSLLGGYVATFHCRKTSISVADAPIYTGVLSKIGLVTSAVTVVIPLWRRG